jgi:uncharacterized membrane protein
MQIIADAQELELSQWLMIVGAAFVLLGVVGIVTRPSTD